MTPSALEPANLRFAFGHFPTGVVAICAHAPHHGPIGMAVSSFVPVSLAPPLVGICVQLSSTTWPLLRLCPTIGISVLGAGQEREARALSARDSDRLGVVPHTRAPAGAIRVDGCSVYFECRLTTEVAAGDHVVALLELLDLEIVEHPGEPLVFHRSRFAGVARPEAG